ncbi:MAG: ATP-binding protein [bacterium]|nr:ATP-binding protein [bacterium]
MAKSIVGESVELHIAANPEELPGVRAALEAFLADVTFTLAERARIVLAVDEAVANVIRHGYGGTCTQPIDITLCRIEEGGRSGMRVTIRDFGRQVDPEAICGRDLDDVRPGGLGVHIMRTVMDEVEYDCAEDGGMRVTLTKWTKP